MTDIRFYDAMEILKAIASWPFRTLPIHDVQLGLVPQELMRSVLTARVYSDLSGDYREFYWDPHTQRWIPKD